MRRSFFSRQELEAPAEEAVRTATKEGYDISFRLLREEGPFVETSWHSKCHTFDEGRPFRRFAGFLVKLVEAETPKLDLLLRRGSHSFLARRSENDHIPLWQIAAVQGSPEAAERHLYKVRWRANRILGPYGLRVSRVGLATGLANADRRIGKAAFAAAEKTALDRFYAVTGQTLLSSDRFAGLKAIRGWQGLANVSSPAAAWVGCRIQEGEFASIREALHFLENRVTLRTDDNIEVAIDRNDPVGRLHGLEVYMTYHGRGEGSRRKWQLPYSELVVSPKTGETYHVGGRNSRRFVPPADYIRSHSSQAISAWKKGRELAAGERLQHEELVRVLKSATVTVEDSYVAGNCSYGTEAWLSQHGLGGRETVPGAALMPHLGYDRVMNVAKVVVRRVLEESQ